MADRRGRVGSSGVPALSAGDGQVLGQVDQAAAGLRLIAGLPGYGQGGPRMNAYLQTTGGLVVRRLGGAMFSRACGGRGEGRR
jgi:hypothetical protein